MRRTALALALWVALLGCSAAAGAAAACELPASQLCALNGPGVHCNPCSASEFVVCSINRGGVMQACPEGQVWDAFGARCEREDAIRSQLSVCTAGVNVRVPDGFAADDAAERSAAAGDAKASAWLGWAASATRLVTSGKAALGSLTHAFSSEQPAEEQAEEEQAEQQAEQPEQAQQARAGSLRVAMLGAAGSGSTALPRVSKLLELQQSLQHAQGLQNQAVSLGKDARLAEELAAKELAAVSAILASNPPDIDAAAAEIEAHLNSATRAKHAASELQDVAKGLLDASAREAQMLSAALTSVSNVASMAGATGLDGVSVGGVALAADLGAGGRRNATRTVFTAGAGLTGAALLSDMDEAVAAADAVAASAAAAAAAAGAAADFAAAALDSGAPQPLDLEEADDSSDAAGDDEASGRVYDDYDYLGVSGGDADDEEPPAEGQEQPSVAALEAGEAAVEAAAAAARAAVGSSSGDPTAALAIGTTRRAAATRATAAAGAAAGASATAAAAASAGSSAQPPRPRGWAAPSRRELEAAEQMVEVYVDDDDDAADAGAAAAAPAAASEAAPADDGFSEPFQLHATGGSELAGAPDNAGVDEVIAAAEAEDEAADADDAAADDAMAAWPYNDDEADDEDAIRYTSSYMLASRYQEALLEAVAAAAGLPGGAPLPLPGPGVGLEREAQFLALARFFDELTPSLNAGVRAALAALDSDDAFAVVVAAGTPVVSLQPRLTELLAPATAARLADLLNEQVQDVTDDLLSLPSGDAASSAEEGAAPAIDAEPTPQDEGAIIAELNRDQDDGDTYKAPSSNDLPPEGEAAEGEAADADAAGAAAAVVQEQLQEEQPAQEQQEEELEREREREREGSADAEAEASERDGRSDDAEAAEAQREAGPIPEFQDAEVATSLNDALLEIEARDQAASALALTAEAQEQQEAEAEAEERQEQKQQLDEQEEAAEQTEQAPSAEEQAQAEASAAPTAQAAVQAGEREAAQENSANGLFLPGLLSDSAEAVSEQPRGAWPLGRKSRGGARPAST